jgi:2-oxoisovalerate dehydrogenase E2 component (dihydrolipoyl transacylase)
MPAKEDVQPYLSTLPSSKALPQSKSPGIETVSGDIAEDRFVALSPIERQMFKVMTRSLAIPHFLYTHNADIKLLNNLRRNFTTDLIRFSSLSESDSSISKLTLLPFIMKAVSQAFLKFPKLNSHLDTTSNSAKAQLVVKGAHNFGLAMDTPHGLLVPVVRNVQSLSVVALAVEIQRLSRLAQEGSLGPEDFKGATFTISNIGSIGGSVVSPVIVAPMVGILAVGRVEAVPVFEVDEQGADKVVKREQVVLSWSADHRVVDGATVARTAEVVGSLMRQAETFGLALPSAEA